MLIRKYGYPLYIYDEREMERRINILKAAFEGFSIFYSIKANPNKKIVSFFSRCGVGADCASANEVRLAKSCGIRKNDIIYSSPGKTREDYREAAGYSVIIADSINELKRLNDYFKTQTAVGVRINPSKGITREKAFEVMGGGSSKFGIDEDTFFRELPEIKKLGNIRIAGLHVYVGSGILDAEVILSNFRNIFGIAARFDYKLDFIDFGGGYGIPYEQGQKELDMTVIGDGIKELVREADMKGTRLITESGRFLTASSGRYLTRITDIKESAGIKYYIIHGGMNGFFRPSFTGTKHGINILNGSQEKERVTVAGHLCTPIDVMISDVMVNKAKIGDILEVEGAGAYGYTMSLNRFISHREPKEIYTDRNGRIKRC